MYISVPFYHKQGSHYYSDGGSFKVAHFFLFLFLGLCIYLFYCFL